MLRIARWMVCAPVVSLLIGGGGCASWQGFRNDLGPTSYQGSYDGGEQEYDFAILQERPLLMIAELDNPRRSVVRWRDIGRGVAQAMSKRLQNRGPLEPWVSPRLGREISQLMEGSASRRFTRMEAIRKENPDLAYILIGKVTDFQHVQAAPRTDDVSAEPTYFALVAIEYSVIDVQSMRVVMTDHISGEADAGLSSGRNEYRSLSFDSYQFLSTPLGRASQQAVDRITRQLMKLPTTEATYAHQEEPAEMQLITPAYLEDQQEPVHIEVARTEPREVLAPTRVVDLSMMIQIDRQITARKIMIHPGAGAGVGAKGGFQIGQTLYVGWFDPQLGRLVAVEDPDTGLPLRAKILKATYNSGVAMLIGLKPIDVDLRKAVLSARRITSRQISRASERLSEVVVSVTDSP